MVGEVLEERYETLDINRGPETILAQIEARFAEFLNKRARRRADVREIGLNVPGPVDVASGRTINPPIMAGWHDFDIRGAFGAVYRCPVVVEKDGTAMAFGEHRRAYPSIPNLVFIKLGTGIGTGIVVDGKPYRGMDGGAGDVGHIAFSGQNEREPLLCRCGNVGCVEAYASGWALVRDLAALGLAVTSIDDVVRLVHLGNPDAIRLVRRASAVFGAAVSDIVSILNPGVGYRRSVGGHRRPAVRRSARGRLPAFASLGYSKPSGLADGAQRASGRPRAGRTRGGSCLLG